MSKKHIILCIIINRTDLIFYTNLIYMCNILNNDIVKQGDGEFYFTIQSPTLSSGPAEDGEGISDLF